jgi:hypothetical protein
VASQQRYVSQRVQSNLFLGFLFSQIQNRTGDCCGIGQHRSLDPYPNLDLEAVIGEARTDVGHLIEHDQHAQSR